MGDRENLHRAELTALERDEQVALWLKLSAEKVSAQLEPKPGRPEGGVRAAARELGIDPTTLVARDLDIGKRLGLARPRVIRQLIDRNLAELEALGPVCRTARQTSVKGRPQARLARPLGGLAPHARGL
ncbi:hypothetical protein [Ancylobacter aquaticus]|uniref:hypothetical protein n=1 Tax=Ancylobacter aquaticus TaxID=100 RepID=UPI00104B275E|nr:hypothetical protein [Ancylobacter aquaticus]